MERGITRLSYDPEQKGKKRPVTDWLAMMGRTRHLCAQEYVQTAQRLQAETDRRWKRLKALAEHPEL